MEPALAARFPEIKNYRGESVERGAWSLRMTHSPQGLSAFVTDGERTVSIQPMDVDGARYYVSLGKDYETLAGEARCLVGETELRGQGELARRTARRNLRAYAPPVGPTKRTYRIAIATTAQYVTDFGGSGGAQSSLTTWVNVLKGIFEKELSVTFTLVTNGNAIGNAQFNGLSLAQMADKSREVLQQNIGLANYDLGLVFGTGATSGLSYIGALCENGGDGGFAYKGGGAVLFATGCGVECNAGNETGSRMLAHEVGHSFGATHTFNADNAQCNPTTRVPETAYESGGGLTLMSNAGNCAGNNIVTARALHFHSGSFEQMAALINDNFGGCVTVPNNNNNPPTVTVNGGTGQVIPKQTPFMLTATGSDDAGDLPNLKYVWEETDAGGAFPNPPYLDQANDPPGTTRPLFRPFAPATSGASRTFPSWEYIRTKGNIPPATDANGLQIADALSQPVHLLETRPDFPGFPLQGCFRPDVPITGGTARTQLARGTCDIPSDAVAIMGNITVVSTLDYPAAGSLTLYASDIPKPNTENSNFNEGETTNNVFTVALGVDGAFKIHPTATKHVVVDVTGYYAPPGNAGLFFHSLPQPIRLLETRNIPGFPLEGCYRPNAKLTGTYDGNSNPNLDQLQQGRVPYTCAMIMPAEVPTSAQLLIGNATTVNTERGGYLTIYPSDALRTFIASSNYAGGDVVNGPFTVRMGPDGKFKIYTFATTDLVIDILGYFSTEAFDQNGAGLLFNPLSKPVRLLETRGTPSNLPGCYKTNAQIQDGFNNPANVRVQPAQGTCEGVTIPIQALAIVGNATVTNQMTGGGSGFLTFWPGNVENRPLAATSNFGAQSPNGYNRHFFVGLSPNGELNAGAFNLLSNVPTDLRVDVSGYFAP